MNRRTIGASARGLAVLCITLGLSSAAASEAGAGGATDADPLFRSASILELELTGPVSRIARDRRADPEERDAVLSWRSPEGDTGTLAVEVRARGKSRRQRDVCAFPPLRLDLPRSETPGTLFEHQDKLKLVTHCVPLGSTVPTQHEYVALERLAYELLNLLTDVSFRVRAVRITYVDDDDGERATHPAFLIEHEDRLAARLGLTVSEATSVPGSVMDADHRTRAEIFQFLIGNTDFSFHASADGERCCHNAVQFVDAAGVHFPVPYDFDRTGLLDKPGVRPARGLGIRRVTERRFVGPCRAPADFDRILDEFRARRAEIDGALAETSELRDRKRGRTERFLDAFWATLEDPRRVERAFLGRCG